MLIDCDIIDAMTMDEAVNHWQRRSRSELKAACILFEKQEPEVYGEVIFHCHLASELALKAKYIQENDTAAPFTHNLSELAKLLDEQWTESDYMNFDQLSDNAVLARYGDEEWHENYATKEKAMIWLEKTEEFLKKIQS
ncbi:HEPN domain-containing protein [Patescibacteria group bacterium]|nr:HEPN domain-containing protein [Patescibacteria group bacterium]MBU1124023.1 HEPN domain-containing protein [Patescibacteria group bacterium]MBU1911274.1 HEPN domain-containing protein [Patescibacteria group bacterium]